MNKLCHHRQLLVILQARVSVLEVHVPPGLQGKSKSVVAEVIQCTGTPFHTVVPFHIRADLGHFVTDKRTNSGSYYPIAERHHVIFP